MDGRIRGRDPEGQVAGVEGRVEQAVAALGRRCGQGVVADRRGIAGLAAACSVARRAEVARLPGQGRLMLDEAGPGAVAAGGLGPRPPRPRPRASPASPAQPLT